MWLKLIKTSIHFQKIDAQAIEEFYGLTSDISKNSESGYILFYQSRDWQETQRMDTRKKGSSFVQVDPVCASRAAPRGAAGPGQTQGRAELPPPFGGSVLTCPNKKSFCSSFLSGLFFGLFFFLSAIFQNLCYLYLKPGCLFVHELKKRFQSSIVGFLPFKVGLRLYLGFCHRFSVF